MTDGMALLYRWYRRKHRYGYEIRMPYRVNLDTLRVTYRQLKNSSGCSAIAWRHWSRGALLMPEGWTPEGWDGWKPREKTDA